MNPYSNQSYVILLLPIEARCTAATARWFQVVSVPPTYPNLFASLLFITTASLAHTVSLHISLGYCPPTAHAIQVQHTSPLSPSAGPTLGHTKSATPPPRSRKGQLPNSMFACVAKLQVWLGFPRVSFSTNHIQY